MRIDVSGRREQRVPERRVAPNLQVLLAVGVTLICQPALSQGPMVPGGAAMAPQPRTAPPPQAPQAPVFVPSAPVVAPPLPMNGAPQGFPSTGGGSGRGTTPGISEDSSPLPSDRNLPVTGGKTGNRGSQSIFDRWGNLFAESSGDAPVSGIGIVSTARADGSVMQVTTNERGMFSLGMLTPGVHEIVLNGKDLAPGADKFLARQQPGDTGTGRPGIIGILIALLLPAVQKADDGKVLGSNGSSVPAPGPLLEHRFAPGQAIRIKITVPKDGSGTTVDWGDGTPALKERQSEAVDHEYNKLATPAGSDSGNGRAETLGRVVFVGPSIK